MNLWMHKLTVRTSDINLSKLLFLTNALLATALLLGLVGLPGFQIPDQGWHNFAFADKAVHASLFALNSLCWVMVFEKNKFYISKKINKNIFIFGIFLAALSEALQHFVFLQRSADMVDFVADSIGVWIVFSYFNHYARST